MQALEIDLVPDGNTIVTALVLVLAWSQCEIESYVVLLQHSKCLECCLQAESRAAENDKHGEKRAGDECEQMNMFCAASDEEFRAFYTGQKMQS